jgi:hypothetical protein
VLVVEAAVGVTQVSRYQQQRLAKSLRAMSAPVAADIVAATFALPLGSPGIGIPGLDPSPCTTVDLSIVDHPSVAQYHGFLFHQWWIPRLLDAAVRDTRRTTVDLSMVDHPSVGMYLRSISLRADTFMLGIESGYTGARRWTCLLLTIHFFVRYLRSMSLHRHRPQGLVQFCCFRSHSYTPLGPSLHSIGPNEADRRVSGVSSPFLCNLWFSLDTCWSDDSASKGCPII